MASGLKWLQRELYPLASERKASVTGSVISEDNCDSRKVSSCWLGCIDLSWISFSIDQTLLVGPGILGQVVLISAAFKHLDGELKKGKAWLMTDTSAR